MLVPSLEARTRSEVCEGGGISGNEVVNHRVMGEGTLVRSPRVYLAAEVTGSSPSSVVYRRPGHIDIRRRMGRGSLLSLPSRELAFLHESSTEGLGVWVLAAFCEVSLKDVQC